MTNNKPLFGNEKSESRKLRKFFDRPVSKLIAINNFSEQALVSSKENKRTTINLFGQHQFSFAAFRAFTLILEGVRTILLQNKLPKEQPTSLQLDLNQAVHLC